MTKYRGYQTSPEGVKVLHFPITPSDDVLDPRPWVLYAAVDLTATLVDENGTALEYVLSAGQILPFSPVKVTAASGTLVGWL